MTYEQLWQRHVEESDGEPNLYDSEYNFMQGFLSAVTLFGDADAVERATEEIATKLDDMIRRN